MLILTNLSAPRAVIGRNRCGATDGILVLTVCERARNACFPQGINRGRSAKACRALLESFGRTTLQDVASPYSQPSTIAVSAPKATMIRSPDALSNGGKRNQPSESELEGESSLFTQAGHVTKFLQDAVQSEHAMHAASPEALQALDTLREASETRGMVVPGDSVGNMYPHATPSLRGSGVGDNGPRPMPPIEMAVACLRKLKTNPRVKFFWALEFQSTGEFIEHLLTVYSTDQATVADHIIVNAGLYWLLVECSNIVDSQALTTEYTRQSKASYMLERCKPSVAWGFIVAASHKSQLLGFHRLATPGRARAAPKKRSTRIFWVIYITEKMLSLRLGRPSTIRDIDISVQLTADVLDSDGAVLPIPARWVHIAQLHGKVYEEIYSLSALGQAEGVRIIRAKSLADELFRVYHAPSPSETCLEVARRQALGESLHELFTRAFHVSYLSLLTLIYRGIPTDGAAGNVAFCDECIVTARQAMEEHGRCIRLLREQTDNVHAFYISWILLMSPFVPFTVLFCHVIQTSDPTDLEHLKSVVEVLQSMPASYVETYSKQHRLFKHFYDVASRYVEVKASARETHPDGSFERLVRESDLRLPIQPSGIDAAETGGDFLTIPGASSTFAGTEQMDFGGAQLGDWYAQNQDMLRMMEGDFHGYIDQRDA
ncbi:fungal specific transcription factor domain-containing protein [Verticillium alfalfae VaMs.102]|uniref:Fungal specific transcription factor domain-containing protein n=1 Tax=Verticillium alfalfae (strain VaMs.102 / ATCC MYA-4576 / FGSC 10136) TaxID=526221 RepID=C9SM00_VERA1|nr:fungal specific transcription factor domain-containing protein [Verticillium alfalfae VaMs.102]EEY19815.1 fungal specific transcription factor domain-containing protein [Verticillium alfalfae VaMs.102]